MNTRSFETISKLFFRSLGILFSSIFFWTQAPQTFAQNSPSPATVKKQTTHPSAKQRHPRTGRPLKLEGIARQSPTHEHRHATRQQARQCAHTCELGTLHIRQQLVRRTQGTQHRVFTRTLFACRCHCSKQDHQPRSQSEQEQELATVLIKKYPRI